MTQSHTGYLHNSITMTQPCTMRRIRRGYWVTPPNHSLTPRTIWHMGVTSWRHLTSMGATLTSNEMEVTPMEANLNFHGVDGQKMVY